MGYILAVFGGILTYGSKRIVKMFNLNKNKELIIKLIGLIIATLGCLKIMSII
ncbi:hypothetical protein PL321_12630 [Caloramator sp. mosi_1]|uniref:hypothetical protein n=1 Tax=Caloramator sp. mosi_1 TaxID=3023090 RepID=UPI00235E8374|nr:hypothetical protein [Caloramator sp. mosi_1]WDC83537.1 hypothetical protein PL321_12630 [Caloramator sp. mosi_1]